jgi:hypothetical protein
MSTGKAGKQEAGSDYIFCLSHEDSSIEFRNSKTAKHLHIKTSIIKCDCGGVEYRVIEIAHVFGM